jgi:hypothetical protein
METAIKIRSGRPDMKIKFMMIPNGPCLPPHHPHVTCPGPAQRTVRVAPYGWCSPVLALSALIPPELLGLPVDDSENALIAGRFRNGGEYTVECLSYD